METPNEIKKFYEDNIYGKWRTGEKVSYIIREKSVRLNKENPDNPFAAMFQLSTIDDGTDVEIIVENNNKRALFTVRAYIPSNQLKEKYPDGFPYIVCMHPVQPKDYALSNGYAMIFMDTSMVAEDNNLRKGCFYDIYPYGKDSTTQKKVMHFYRKI